MNHAANPLTHSPWFSLAALWQRKTTIITVLSLGGIGSHLLLRFGAPTTKAIAELPLFVTLVIGGLPMLYELLRKLLRREFGSDLLGGISIVTSVVLGEYLAGSIIVLMLAGGEALESYALRSASSVLAVLAKRMPSVAHRKSKTDIVDISLSEVAVGDTLVIFPHDICPADGVVMGGQRTACANRAWRGWDELKWSLTSVSFRSIAVEEPALLLPMHRSVRRIKV